MYCGRGYQPKKLTVNFSPVDNNDSSCSNGNGGFGF